MAAVGGEGGGEGRGHFLLLLSAPCFHASRNKNIGDSIRIAQEILCLPYSGF